MITRSTIKLIGLHLATLLVVACTQKSASQVDGKIRFKEPEQCKDCRDCVYIPDIIEPDTVYSKLISTYFISSLQGEEFCTFLTATNKEKLYQRSSLVDAIVSAYLQGVEMPESFGETYFSDHKIELLFHIENRDVLYEVTDTLLYREEADGLMVLWDNLDTTKLSHFEKYYNKILSSDNIFLIAELTVSMHLNGYKKLEAELLNKAATIEGFEEQYNALQKLLSGPTFDYSEYLGKIYYSN